jgi:hypothetical protein
VALSLNKSRDLSGGRYPLPLSPAFLKRRIDVRTFLPAKSAAIVQPILIKLGLIVNFSRKERELFQVE